MRYEEEDDELDDLPSDAAVRRANKIHFEGCNNCGYAQWVTPGMMRCEHMREYEPHEFRWGTCSEWKSLDSDQLDLFGGTT